MKILSVLIFSIIFLVLPSRGRAAAQEEKLTLERLQRAVDEFPARGTLEQFLEKYIVPQPFHLIFVHETGSIQYGDEDSPRVLLVSPDSRLTLSFSGYENSVGWETIEAMEVSSKPTEPFIFGEIVFPANSLGSARELPKVTYNGFGSMERRCAGCHRNAYEKPMGPIFLPDTVDGGVWGGNGVWNQDTLLQWSKFQKNYASHARYKIFSNQIEGETPEHMSKVVRAYFSDLKNSF